MADQTSAENFDQELEGILRELGVVGTTLETPPAAIWDRIEAEVAIDAPLHEEAAPIAPVIDLSERRNRNKRLAVFGGAVAAAALAVAAFASITRDATPSLVAVAELAYDAESFDPLGSDAGATVSLRDDDGTLEIDFDSSDLPNTEGEDADLELWLIEPDANGQVADIVSLGLIDKDNPGVFDIPEGYDPSVFYVVDISVEPRDGDHDHSGRSILRGALAVT